MQPFRRVAAVALVTALASLTAGVPASGSTHESARLQDTRDRLSAIQDEIAAAEGEVGDTADALRTAERQLAAALDAVDDAQAAVDRQQRAVDDARERAAAFRRAAEQRQATLTERAVSLYKAGGASPQFAILSGGGPGDLVRRAALINRITVADRQVIEEQRAAGVAEKAVQDQLQVEEDALQEVLGEQRELMAQVEQIRDSRAIQLAERQSGLAELRQQEQTLEADSRQLAATIARTQRAQAAARAARAAEPAAPAHADPPPAPSAAAAGATASAGGWGWPVNGSVTSEYGYRWGRMHEGIDIAAPTGTPLLAARAGTVTYAGTMSGYGYVTLIDHGGGFVTAYAHQNRLIASAGQRVAQGQQIGEVGSTGRSTGPHVHFEVRLNGSPRNPRGYLP